MDVAAAIAEPVRREILMLLRDRVLTAGEIADRFPISRPAVSRHLRVLRTAGLVRDERRGRQRFYRLDAGPLAPLEEWLAGLRGRWAEPFDALETEVYRARRDRRPDSSKPKERSA